MSSEKVNINRTLVGVLAVACLAAAGVLFVRGAETGPAHLWQGAFVRVGVLMSAFWFALPSKKRKTAYAIVSWQTLLGLLLLLFAMARFPRTVIPVVVVMAVIGYFLRPRNRSPSGPRFSR